MKKLIIVAACVLGFASNIYAASLPSVGYEGPYQAPGNEYGFLPDDFYDGSGGFTDFSMTVSDNTIAGDETVDCTLYGMGLYPYCAGCLTEITPGLSSCDDVLDAIDDFPGGPFAYEICANSTCGGPIDCALGLCPIDAETPLIFFAFAYLAVRIWRRKKKT